MTKIVLLYSCMQFKKVFFYLGRVTLVCAYCNELTVYSQTTQHSWRQNESGLDRKSSRNWRLSGTESKRKSCDRSAAKRNNSDSKR